jgi:hypothetical protein
MVLLSQAPPLGYLSSPHSAFQEHAAHTTRWPVVLSSKGSQGTCIPCGVSTFLLAACTAHSGDSPYRSSAKHHLLDTCLLLMVPFRSMLLTLRGGPESLAPRAHRIPVYPMGFYFHSYMPLARRTPSSVQVRPCRPAVRAFSPA